MTQLAGIKALILTSAWRGHIIIKSWLLLPKHFLFFSFRTTTSLKSILTPSVSPMTPTTYDQAWVKSAWTVTRWCCPSTMTVSPAWRSCLLESTAEKAVIMTALLLRKGFPTANAEGMSDILKHSGKRLTFFLLIYSLPGQNETIYSISRSPFPFSEGRDEPGICIFTSYYRIKYGQNHQNFSSHLICLSKDPSSEFKLKSESILV